MDGGQSEKLLKNLKIDGDGFFTDLGKFEGEPAWVAYFYASLGEGQPEETDWSADHGVTAERFQVTVEERQAFPDLAFEDFVVIDVGPSGFVYGHYGSLWNA